MITKLTGLAAFLTIPLLTLFVSGQTQPKPASVTISSISIDAEVKPGTSYTQNFIVTNDSNQAIRFRCSFEDFGYDEQNRRIDGRAGTLPRSASLWVQFTPKEVTVEAMSTKVITAVVTVPVGVSGSFFTVPVFEGFPVNGDLPPSVISTATIGLRLRGLMILTTDKGSDYNVEIIGGTIIPPAAASEMDLALELRNRGTAVARIRGAFAILDATGKLVGRGKIDEKRLVPTQHDIMRAKWPGELAPGGYTSVVTLSYNRVGSDPRSMVYEIPFTVK